MIIKGAKVYTEEGTFAEKEVCTEGEVFTETSGDGENGFFSVLFGFTNHQLSMHTHSATSRFVFEIREKNNMHPYSHRQVRFL